jgi:hypothetical protein
MLCAILSIFAFWRSSNWEMCEAMRLALLAYADNNMSEALGR